MRRRLTRRTVMLEAGNEAAVLGARGAWTVLISGASSGGPERLTGELLAVLMEVERRGLHTVLLAGEREDLHTAVAAVTRYVLTDHVAVAQEAQQVWGDGNVMEIPAADRGHLAAVLRRLPVPASRTWQRILVRRLRWLRRGR